MELIAHIEAEERTHAHPEHPAGRQAAGTTRAHFPHAVSVNFCVASDKKHPLCVVLFEIGVEVKGKRRLNSSVLFGSEHRPLVEAVAKRANEKLSDAYRAWIYDVRNARRSMPPLPEPPFVLEMNLDAIVAEVAEIAEILGVETSAPADGERFASLDLAP